MTDRHPIGGRMSDVVAGLGGRLRLSWLRRRYNSTFVLGVFAFVNGCVSIGLMALVALATGQPFVFPSLGPTAFLLFYSPHLAASSPRNTIVGHAIGAGAGYLSLVMFGLRDVGPAVAGGVSGPRVVAAALSLGLTAGAMAWLRVPHPPAGATTLIVSLGIIRAPTHIGVLMLGVVLLVFQGYAINRLAGVAYPAWSPKE